MSAFLRRIQANNAEAERIMAKHRAGAHTEAQQKDRHVWPDAKPDVPQWRDVPPSEPGTYRWRMTEQWESIYRAVDEGGMTHSNRFRQPVLAIRVGGEWFY